MATRTDWLKLENRIRATPMDLLKQGLEEGSWEAVAACYTMLTGQVCQTLPKNKIIEFPDGPAEVRPEPPITLIPQPIEIPSAQPKRKRGRPKKKTTIVPEVGHIPPNNPVPTITNEFRKAADIEAVATVDDLSNCTAPAKDPNKKEKIYAHHAPHDTSPRKCEWVDDETIAPAEIVRNRVVPKELQLSRPPVQMIKVRCKGCGKVEAVESSVVASLKLPGAYTMRYLCNECTVGGGGAASEFEDIPEEDDDE